MKITIRYFTILRSITGKRQESLRMKLNSTLEDMLNVLVKKYGDDFARYVSSSRTKKGLQLVFLVNGQDASQHQGFKTTLHDGDKVALIPPIAGG